MQYELFDDLQPTSEPGKEITPERVQLMCKEIAAVLWRNVGNNVRTLRQGRGITQEMLSEMTGGTRHGVSVRTIARLEGGRVVSQETLLSIAGALDVPVDQFKELNLPPGDPKEERQTLAQVAKANNIAGVPVTVYRAEGAAELIAVLDDCSGVVGVGMDRLPECREEDAVALLDSLLKDYALVWSELDLAEKFAAKREFAEPLKVLHERGFCLYLGRVTYNFGPDTKGRPIPVRFVVVHLSRRNVAHFATLVANKVSFA